MFKKKLLKKRDRHAAAGDARRTLAARTFHRARGPCHSNGAKTRHNARRTHRRLALNFVIKPPTVFSPALVCCLLLLLLLQATTPAQADAATAPPPPPPPPSIAADRRSPGRSELELELEGTWSTAEYEWLGVRVTVDGPRGLVSKSNCAPRPKTCHGLALPVHERERSTEKYSESVSSRRRRRACRLSARHPAGSSYSTGVANDGMMRRGTATDLMEQVGDALAAPRVASVAGERPTW